MSLRRMLIALALASAGTAAPAAASTPPLSSQDAAALALASGGGRTLAVYVEAPGRQPRVVSRGLDGRGRPTGRLHVLGRPGPPTLVRPVVAWNPVTACFLVTWYDADGVHVRRLGRDGAALGRDRRVAAGRAGTGPGPGGAHFPHLSVDRTDGTAVVSLPGTDAIVAVSVDRRGRPARRGVRIPGPPDHRGALDGAVTVLPDGGRLAVVAANLAGQAGELFARRLDGRANSLHRMTTGTAAHETLAEVAFHPGTARGLIVADVWGALAVAPLDRAGRRTAPFATLPESAAAGQATSLLALGHGAWAIAYRRHVAGVDEYVLRRLNARGRPAGQPVIVAPGPGDPFPTGFSLGRARAGGVLAGWSFQTAAAVPAIAVARIAP